MRPVANVRPSSHFGRSASCCRSDRILGGRRRVDRDVPAGAARRGEDLRDRRRLAPDEQRRRARTTGSEHLRREVGVARGHRQLRRHRLGIARERLVERRSSLLAVRRVVVDEGQLQALRDRVFGEPERDAAIRRRDAVDVRPLLEIDEAPAAVVRDADRDVRVVRDLPAASTPVPSSTIATAPSEIARRMFASALRGDSALSYRFTSSV